MKKTKKLIGLAIAAVMSASIFAGCSSNGMELYNGFAKTQSIKSLESKSEFSVKVSGTNLSPQEEQALAMLSLKDGLRINSRIKSTTNKDNSISKSEMKINVNINNTNINTGIWSDINLSGSKPVGKTIIEIPDMVKMFAPEIEAKKYLSMDSFAMQDLQSQAGQPSVDYKKIVELSKGLEPKLMKFMGDYAKQFNFNKNLITKVENKNLLVGGKNQEVTVYEIKLNDKDLKDLLRYTVNNLGQNKDLIGSFGKDFISALTPSLEIPAKELQLPSQMPDFTKELNKGLDAIKDIKILGDKGLTLRYAINKAGYIVNVNGNVDFLINTANLKKPATAAVPGPTGVYTVTLGFYTDLYNINENISIALPTLTPGNSIDFMDLIKSQLKANK